MKQAVILAAGRGCRISSVSNGTPKCLLRVGDETLLERQLRILHEVGIASVCVVVGHEHEAVRAAVGARCDVVVNERFDETNSLYSLWRARDWVRGPFVLMNSDVLAHPDIYHRVFAMNGCALAYDSSSGQDEEHMKVSLRSGLVHALSKNLPVAETSGENVGILQFDGSGARLLFEEADRIVADGGLDAWAPSAVARVAARRPIRAIDVCDLPWTEIDFPDDLLTAKQQVQPSIDRGHWVKAER